MVEYLVVPRINPNDDQGVLGNWLVSSGVKVTKGQRIWEFITDKASFEVLAEHDGLIFPFLEAGTPVEVGSIVGCIASNAQEAEAARESKSRKKSEPKAEALLQAPWRFTKVIPRRGILDPSEFTGENVAISLWIRDQNFLVLTVCVNPDIKLEDSVRMADLRFALLEQKLSNLAQK